MYIGFQHLHSYLAYFALAALVAAIGYAAFSWLSNKPFTKASKILAITGLVSAHIQLVVGFLLYFLSPRGFANLSGDAMGDTISRLY
ncbi:MAG: hypothetical protein WD491_06130, partial [Balneolales bacterium]